ncbi:hypothetical protein BD626DRAFT_569179 [Schizophyllum amplum]|uniref:Uncharacterized protein n=1 Tax=Schizophyllum amplum TaxID=97359 RepID=A0A550CEA2_9AGAR|nr:hypothetical protein BD626DRAFT_569179 [Auriculariopsis ampla]
MPLNHLSLDERIALQMKMQEQERAAGVAEESVAPKSKKRNCARWPKSQTRVHLSWRWCYPAPVLYPARNVAPASASGCRETTPSPVPEVIDVEEWLQADVSMDDAQAPSTADAVHNFLQILQKDLQQLLDAGQVVNSLENTTFTATVTNKARRARVVESGKKVVTIAQSALAALNALMPSIEKD